MTFISSFQMNLAEKGEGDYTYYENQDGLYLVRLKYWPSGRNTVDVYFRAKDRVNLQGGWGVLGPDRKHMTFCEKLFMFDSLSNRPYFFPGWLKHNEAIHKSLVKVLPFSSYLNF